VVNARDGHASVNHGTHVASIAAGAEVRDGAGNVLLHAGMAPKAKIAVVRGGSLGLAIRYLFKKASELGANVPCVINMSFGSHDNAHDGSDEDARVVAAEMKDSAGNYRPGRILVAAAGNERNKDIHVRKRFGFGIQTLRYQTNKDQDTGVRSEPVTIWVRNEGSGAPIYGIRVSNPTTAAQSSSWYFSTSANNTHNVPGRPLRIRVRFSPQDPANGDYNARVEFQTTDGSALVREEWQIQVLNFMASQIDVHAWSAWETGKFLGLAPDDASFLVCSPATSRDVISVASMNSRLNWTDIDGTAQNFGQTALGDISSYSSPGPCRTATNNVLNLFGLRLDLSPDAVDIAAPGSAIAAARGTDVLLTAPPGASTQVQQWVAGNRRRSVSTKAQMLQGTSMATPVVTGIIANILAEEPNLTQADVTRRLQESVAVSERPSTTAFDAPGNVDREDWGVARGYLRAHKLRRPGP
jgi:subtilisin family serine protease